MVTRRVPADVARSSVAPSGLVTERWSEPLQAARYAVSNTSTAQRVKRPVPESATGRHVATRVGGMDDLTTSGEWADHSSVSREWQYSVPQSTSCAAFGNADPKLSILLPRSPRVLDARGAASKG